ncbi:MAG: glycosyltransferase [Candidatus Roizmanbacteria bacterium]|nr:glycosyltransferase [Candidatus Roizmanbacteria bacterium]
MKQTLFFSVIIPTLNEERDLPHLLSDIHKQKPTNIEVLIADAYSSDKTSTILKQTSQKLPLSILQTKKKNVSHQRNTGAKNARGKYIIFLDADSRLPPQFFSKLEEFIIHNKGFLYSLRMSTNEQKNEYVFLLEIGNLVIDFFNRVGKPFAAGTGIVVHRELFYDLGGFDESLKLAEDHDFVQRARKAGIHLCIPTEPTLHYSFRRPQRIGYLRFLVQYLIASMYTLTGTEIKKDLFDYPMGGSLYTKSLPSPFPFKVDKLSKKLTRAFKLLFE